ncbi:MAG: hypothetical protein K6E35_06215 [Bacteroidales bacterium]|nr:hypothetical protein [Bacteroidales bacterium]
MKRSTTLFLAALLLLLASCGTPAQYSQQRFSDGIYARPGEEPEIVRLYTEKDFEDMAAAKVSRKSGRDTLVVILDDPWDYSWYRRYDHFRYPRWAWGGIGLSSYYWSGRYYSGWYDPWYGPWYDSWYGYDRYGWYSGWYDPWYGDWYYYPYGHRYGWYDHPYYPGGSWGGSHYYSNRVYSPRSLTTVGGSRELRPGSGANTRRGGSYGSRVINNTRSATNRSRVNSSASSSSNRGGQMQYSPTRSYTNKYSRGTQSSGTTRQYSSSSSSGSSSRSYSSGSSSSGSSRSYSGGGGSSHSSGGGSSSRGGGRR